MRARVAYAHIHNLTNIDNISLETLNNTSIKIKGFEEEYF